MRRIQRLAFILSATSLFGSDEAVHDIHFKKKVPPPWFTGPLLAPSAYTVEPGHYSLEPYYSFTRFGDFYNEEGKKESRPGFYTTNLFMQTKFGLTSATDIFIGPQVIFNHSQGVHTAGLGDIPVAMQFQLYRPNATSSWPAFRLSVRASLPIGKYEHLSASKKGTDAMGNGSWLPGVTLSTGKLWYIKGFHYFEYRWSVGYQIGTPVHVKGINFYGGAPDTHGTAYLGNRISSDFAVQYSFTQRWAMACDLFYTYRAKNRFSGFAGTLPTGAKASMRAKPASNLSVAPALEYSWSENLGVIGGVWWSVWGRNSRDFVSGVFAVCIYI